MLLFATANQNPEKFRFFTTSFVSHATYEVLKLKHADEVRVLTVTKENLRHFQDTNLRLFAQNARPRWMGKPLSPPILPEMSAFLKTSTLIGVKLSRNLRLSSNVRSTNTWAAFTHRVLRFFDYEETQWKLGESHLQCYWYFARSEKTSRSNLPTLGFSNRTCPFTGE